MRPIYAQNGRIVARADCCRMQKVIQGSKHFLRTPPAIAFDVFCINQAKKMNLKEIHVLDSETRTLYIVDMETFLAKSLQLNRGFGEQMALTMEYWKVEKK